MSEPSHLDTLRKGIRCRCPRCGEGPLLKGLLTVRDSCPKCGLSYAFADPADGPAFFVMSLVGVIGMVGFMAFEFTVHPPIWVHAVVTLPLVVALCLGALRPFKGWLVCEQYVRKAEEARFESIGRHGDGSPWR